MCAIAGVGYLDVDVKDWHLHSDGLHLNTSGQNHVAGAIFRHVRYLN